MLSYFHFSKTYYQAEKNPSFLENATLAAIYALVHILHDCQQMET